MVLDNGFSLKEIEIGMFATYSQTITDTDVKSFAGLSSDNNPVHMSDEYAIESRFKKRIAHGLLSASFFSALFGTKLLGPGCVYVSQNLNFHAPVFLGDTVVAKVIVMSVDLRKKIIYFSTTCSVQNKVVISGEAGIYVPRQRKVKL
jgi:3-hydroxybutyryl-CoA dehydratase